MQCFAASLRFIGLSTGLAVLLSACVATQPAVVSPEVAFRQAPVEAAETAYLSRADGPHNLPAIPLEKLPEALRRQPVDFKTDMAPGSIVIHPGEKFLYFVTGKNKAIRYGISVGRAGFEWAGEAVVSRTRQWPTWTPPPEMIARDPKLAKWQDGQPGGPANPLGARAIYLLTDGRDYGYRIHGTPDWWSIGRNASSGCIRMIQQDVIDLNTRVQPGAHVLVLNADGTVPAKLKLPPPAPKKRKPVVVTPVVATAAATTPIVTPAEATPAPIVPVVEPETAIDAAVPVPAVEGAAIAPIILVPTVAATSP
jgi:lipoprotein-anchoring transpeptidase ErfK/SrfK